MGVLVSKCDDKEKAKLAKKPTCDIFRENPIRMLGYACHLGVCSNVLSPRVIVTGQMISTAYILSDVFQKSKTAAKKLEPENVVINKSLDALLWQILASVIIPGFILSRTRSLTRSLIRKTAAGAGKCGPSSKHMNYIPCITSLLVAPFIMKPIDRCVDYVMDNSIRPMTKPAPPPKVKVSGPKF